MRHQHLTRQQRRHIPRTGRLGNGITAADLIDTLITSWPSYPRFASLLVDRLMQGDKGLAIRNREN